jgi:hypothetical protein
MHFSKGWAAVWLCGLLTMMAACDSAPGPENLGTRLPTLSEFSFSPQSIVLEQLPPEQIDGENVLVPLELSVQAVDPNRRMEQVAYVVQSPDTTFDPVATGVLIAAGNNRYTASETIALPRALVGAFNIIVYAVTTDQQLSSEVRGAIHLFATGEPPVIESIEAPESVQRPAAGEPPVRFQYVAVVSDPDGLRNIENVEVELGDVGTFNLCDDGGGSQSCNGGFADSGDETAGDGRFTLTLEVASTNAPATLTLRFKAIDRSGLESEVVERTFTIL